MTFGQNCCNASCASLVAGLCSPDCVSFWVSVSVSLRNENPTKKTTLPHETNLQRVKTNNFHPNYTTELITKADIFYWYVRVRIYGKKHRHSTDSPRTAGRNCRPLTCRLITVLLIRVIWMGTGLQYIYCEEPIKWLFLVAQSNDISSSSVIRVTAIVRVDTAARYWCADRRGNSTENFIKIKSFPRFDRNRQI